MTTEQNKKCFRCGEVFPLTSEYFFRSKYKKDGFRNTCKKCVKHYLSKRLPPDLNFKKCPNCNVIYPRTTEYFYRGNQKWDGLAGICKKCRGIETYKWQKNNPDKVKKSSKAAREKRNLNKHEEVLQYQQIWKKEKYDNDIGYHIKIILRQRVKSALRGKLKVSTTLSLLGCTTGQLISYLESKFTLGMTWDNYGQYGWHIDHVIPCAAFDLTDPEQQKQCFHYTNLQPLWNIDNRKKGSLYNGVRHKKAS